MIGKRTLLLLFAIVSIIIVMSMTLIPQKTNATSSNDEPQYKLAWVDDFDNNTLDETRWSKIKRLQWGWCDYMSPDSRLYRIKRGYIRLYCRRNTWLKDDTASVLTGGITTEGKYTIRYGKVEVRARMTGAMGCWPAIWLKNSNYKNGGIDRAELDIVERYNYDKKVFHTAHNHYIDVQKKQEKDVYTKGYDVNVEKWNTYAVEILPTKIIFSVNGKNTLIYPKLPDDIHGQWPYEKGGSALYIDMQWSSNRWLKDIRPEELPAHMDIDWVKIYELK